MVKIAIAVILTLVLCCSCSDITEHSSTVAAGLNMYDAETLTWLGSFPVSPSAKAMLIRDNRVYLTGSDGYIRSYHTVEQELIEEEMIGPASPSGYNAMAYNHFRKTIYIVGSTGNIIEVSIPHCEVQGVFSVCATPVMMEVTTGSPGYLWVVDGVSNSISQVHLETSGLCGSVGYPDVCQIRAVEASIYEDSLLVGTSRGFFKLTTFSPGVFRNEYINDFDVSCAGLASIPGDSNFVAVLGAGSKQAGEIWVYSDSVFLWPPPKFYNKANINGSFFLTASGSDPSRVHLLAGGFEESSRLSNYTTGDNYGIHQFAEVPGNPLAIAEDDGIVYVLSYE